MNPHETSSVSEFQESTTDVVEAESFDEDFLIEELPGFDLALVQGCPDIGRR